MYCLTVLMFTVLQEAVAAPAIHAESLAEAQVTLWFFCNLY